MSSHHAVLQDSDTTFANLTLQRDILALYITAIQSPDSASVARGLLLSRKEYKVR